MAVGKAIDVHAFGRRRLDLTISGGRIELIVGMLILVGIFVAPFFAPQDPLQTSANVLAAPSAQHLLGTDEVGRDVFSRFLAGGRLIALLSIGAGLVSVIIGGFVGTVAGYLRGLTDTLLMRSVDVALAMPAMLVILLFASALPRNNWDLVILAGVLNSPGAARILRGVTQQYAAREFVMAAEAAGDRWYSILFFEIVPNLRGRLLLELALRTGYATILISSLNFLGLGVSPPAADWGLMVSDAQKVMSIAPISGVAPAIALAVLVAAVNLIADGFTRELK